MILLLKKNIFSVFFSFFLFFLILCVYRFLFDSFFQQDEWYSLGQAIHQGVFAGLKDSPLIYYLAGYIRFPGTLLNNTIHYYFPLNTIPFVVTGILLHWINSSLVFLLSFSLTKKKLIACLSAVFFAISNVHQQTISWFAATMTALPSLIFALLSILLSLYAIKGKKIYILFIAQLSMIVSFLFKESSIVLLVLLPLLSISSKPFSKKNIYDITKIYIPSMLYVLYVLLIRFMILNSPEGRVGVFVTTEKDSTSFVLHQIFTYPFIGFFQTFVPIQLFQKFIDIFKVDYDAGLKITDTISIILSGSILVLSISLAKFKKTYRTTILTSIFIAFVSFVPLAVLKRNHTSYFESRYYYVASVGVGIIFGVFIYLLIQKILQNKSLKRLGIVFALFILILIYFYKQISLTRAFLLQQNIEGQERKKILTKITQFFPEVKQKPIFFVDGDSLGYYGIPKQKIPFQQGIGFTLMVLYYNQGVIPGELLDQAYLWDVHQEGFKEVGQQGFGYFSSYDSLKNELKNHPKSDIDNIYGVYWQSSEKKLENITDTIRQRLKTEK